MHPPEHQKNATVKCIIYNIKNILIHHYLLKMDIDHKYNNITTVRPKAQCHVW